MITWASLRFPVFSCVSLFHFASLRSFVCLSIYSIIKHQYIYFDGWETTVRGFQKLKKICLNKTIIILVCSLRLLLFPYVPLCFCVLPANPYPYPLLLSTCFPCYYMSFLAFPCNSLQFLLLPCVSMRFLAFPWVSLRSFVHLCVCPTFNH